MIDYVFYSEIYKGNLIPQDNFEKYANRASNKVKNRILNRDYSLFENNVKKATCSVAEILYDQFLNKEKLKNIISGTDKVVTSEKVGDYSRNIANISISELQNLVSDDYVNSLIEQELEDYLLYTGLLYCGVPNV